MDFQLEKVGAERVWELQAIARKTFADTFAWGNSSEDLQAYLDAAYSMEKLAAELCDPGIEYWFAVVDEKPVGFLMLGLHSIRDGLEGSCMEIKRIYVLEDHLGSGVGQRLFDLAVERARGMDRQWLWLGVWKENPRAIRFYQRNGMEIIAEQAFAVGSDVQEDWVLARRVF